MDKAKQVVVEEILENGTVNTCAGIQIGNKLIFADNGDVIDLPASHIEITEYLSWIDISDAILGN